MDNDAFHNVSRLKIDGAYGAFSKGDDSGTAFYYEYDFMRNIASHRKQLHSWNDISWAKVKFLSDMSIL